MYVIVSGVDPGSALLIHQRIQFDPFCLESRGTVYSQELIQHTGAAHLMTLSLPQVFKSHPSLSGNNTQTPNTCKIGQSPPVSATVCRRWLVSCSWRHRRVETLVTNRLRPEQCQFWPDQYFSSPNHKISLPYKSQQPRALFLPVETYSLNVLELMANE